MGKDVEKTFSIVDGGLFENIILHLGRETFQQTFQT